MAGHKKKERHAATVLISGGMDSIACAHFLQSKGHKVQGVFIDFGQPAAQQESRAATLLAHHINIPLACYKINGKNSYTSGELPGRNAFLIFSSILLSNQHSGLVGIGIHAGTPYYDCSPSFFDSMTRLLAEYFDGKVTLVAPFLDWTKADIFDYFVSSGLPLNKTYSCESSSSMPCGICASCHDRARLAC